MTYRKITRTLKDGMVESAIEWDGWDHVSIIYEDDSQTTEEVFRLGNEGWQICAATDGIIYMKRERVE